MGDVTENKAVFGGSWDWSTQGEEWSEWLGGTTALWQDVLLPRLRPYLPARTLLEIAPGYGRISQFLQGQCERLILVDLAENCIEACRTRFAEADHISYFVNDGKSLSMIDDNSVDLVVTWDSLVHAEMDVLEAYIREFGRILTPDGVAWVHHSNVAAIRLWHEVSMRAPERVRRPLVKRGMLLDVYAWRAPSVSADKVARVCRENGLVCRRQEVLPWEHGRYLTDAISLIARADSADKDVTRTVRNRTFQRDARARAAGAGAQETGRVAAGEQ